MDYGVSPYAGSSCHVPPLALWFYAQFARQHHPGDDDGGGTSAAVRAALALAPNVLFDLLAALMLHRLAAKLRMLSGAPAMHALPPLPHAWALMVLAELRHAACVHLPCACSAMCQLARRWNLTNCGKPHAASCTCPFTPPWVMARLPRQSRGRQAGRAGAGERGRGEGQGQHTTGEIAVRARPVSLPLVALGTPSLPPLSPAHWPPRPPPPKCKQGMHARMHTPRRHEPHAHQQCAPHPLDAPHPTSTPPRGRHRPAPGAQPPAGGLRVPLQPPRRPGLRQRLHIAAGGRVRHRGGDARRRRPRGRGDAGAGGGHLPRPAPRDAAGEGAAWGGEAGGLHPMLLLVRGWRGACWSSSSESHACLSPRSIQRLHGKRCSPERHPRGISVYGGRGREGRACAPRAAVDMGRGWPHGTLHVLHCAASTCAYTPAPPAADPANTPCHTHTHTLMPCGASAPRRRPSPACWRMAPRTWRSHCRCPRPPLRRQPLQPLPPLPPRRPAPPGPGPGLPLLRRKRSSSSILPPPKGNLGRPRSRPLQHPTLRRRH